MRSLICFQFVLIAVLTALTGCEPGNDVHRGLLPHLRWESRSLSIEGRIDAIAGLGHGVVVAGSRALAPGEVYRSCDGGQTWEIAAEIHDPEPWGTNITCIASGKGEVAYLLTGNSCLWQSSDWGQTWGRVGKVSHQPCPGPFQLSYGLVCLESGTLLVSDTGPNGGYVYRLAKSAESWETIGPVSEQGLYRFQVVADGVIVNGWAGQVYKSGDDGRNWTRMSLAAPTPLYATEYLGRGIVLQGSDAGNIYRSTDNGRSWTDLGVIGQAADDFVSLGDGTVIYSTYAGDRHMYLSTDWGASWRDIGPVPTGVANDWFDHVIAVPFDGTSIAIGGTGKGHVVRATQDVEDVSSESSSAEQ